MEHPLTANELVDRAELRELEDSIEAVSDDCICVGCGCSNRHACPEGCTWIAWHDTLGICSRCVVLSVDELVRRQKGRVQRAVMTARA
jgi:hypothetical protein